MGQVKLLSWLPRGVCLGAGVLAVAAPLPVMAQVSAIQQKYATCIDYFVIGNTECRPQASTPVAAPGEAPRLLGPDQPEQTASAPSSADLQSRIDDYLQNYGKPPREFVAFYLEPTQENAIKWVEKYQEMLQRGQSLSQAWTQADDLYKQMAQKNNINVDERMLTLPSSPAVSEAVAAATTSDTETSLSQVSIGAGQSAGVSERIGAFTQPEGLGVMQIGGTRAPIQLTYYFSATCPYCAKMTPELAELKSKQGSELELTCVDVTPLGVSTRPNPANITGKLPCKWRVPNTGEVEEVQVRQTPTLLIRKGDVAPVKLSGYVPLAQLRAYLEGRRVQ